MKNTVTAVFEYDKQVEQVTDVMKKHGYDSNNISVIKQHGDTAGEDRKDGISDGLVTGGAIGAVAGILAGAGTIAVPGLGILAAAGPITGMLTGAATGGLVGGLVDMGLSENEGKEYETHLKDGATLFSVKVSGDDVSDLSEILKDYGGKHIKVH